MGDPQDTPKQGIRKLPIVQILLPLLLLIGLALVYGAVSRGQRDDAQVALDAVVADATTAPQCAGAAQVEIELSEYELDQPITLNSFLLGSGSAVFSRPLDGAEDLVEVAEVVLRSEDDAWCVDEVKMSERAAG